MVGSSMKSLSMKKKRGISTSSPARSFCSSKQKHSIFAKYGAAYAKTVIVEGRYGNETDRRTFDGVTLYVAMPMISLSDTFLAV